MKTNVRLARGIRMSYGMVDAYVISSSPAKWSNNIQCEGWITSSGDYVRFWLSRREFEELPFVTLEVNPAMVPYACERGHRTNEVSGSGPVLAWCCSEDIGGWCGDDEYVACNKPLMQVCD